MNEAGLWAYIKKGMMAKWHTTRIESSAGSGIPDVSFSICGKNGFLELKYIKEWPKRKTTKVKIPLRPEQKHWISSRIIYGSDIWVCIRIENDFILMSGHLALINIKQGGWTREEFDQYFIYKWENRIDFNRFSEALQDGC